MKINRDWETKYMELWFNKKFTEAKRMVFELRMKEYNKLIMQDKIILDYRMAYFEYLDNNTNMANMYLDILENIFSDEFQKKANENYYYRYKWLYVNNNKGFIDNNILLNEMLQIYGYFKELKDEATTIVALENIADIKGDKFAMIENIEKLLKYKGKKDWNLIDSMVKDCDKISHDLYITALKLVNKYKLNIDLQVV